MKKTIIFLLAAFVFALPAEAKLKNIQLNSPDKTGGLSILESLWDRKSTRAFADSDLSKQQLSNLLWAANGFNRPKEKKRTAASGMNRQNIKVYAATKDGVYLYNAAENLLEAVSEGDVRPVLAPVVLILVASEPSNMTDIDAGIISGNISLFCAGTGLATVPRGQMDRAKLAEALKLDEKEKLILNHPVGFAK